MRKNENKWPMVTLSYLKQKQTNKHKNKEPQMGGLEPNFSRCKEKCDQIELCKQHCRSSAWLQ